MAKINNPVVGTMECIRKGCDEQVTVHQNQRGGANRKGGLYIRCPSCTCLQPSGEASQRFIRQNVNPREGFEHLAESKPVQVKEPEQPNKNAGLEGDVILKEEPESEPKSKTTNNLAEPRFLGVLLALSLGVAAIVVR